MAAEPVTILRVAIDVPLEGPFDFLPLEGRETPVGSLVAVPFGRTRKIGVVVGHAATSEVPAERLKPVLEVIEDVPPIGQADLDLFAFCAGYYQRPLGEVISASLPPRLRQLKRRRLPASVPVGSDTSKPGSRLGSDTSQLGSDTSAPGLGTSSPQHSDPGLSEHSDPSLQVSDPSSLALTPAQVAAVAAIAAGAGRFHPVLLHGVTGSGKTEVYLQAMEAALRRGTQALMLVPEIGLTPQLEAHVRSRFPGAAFAAAHSHLSEGDRARAWLASQSGAAQVVLGTRLAVLMPFQRLGLIVVDEEHDASYKQQEGLRYNARDVAVLRAQRAGIPVVLGSATPSLESLENSRAGRYQRIDLPERAAANARMPRVRMIDTRADRPTEGLTHGLVLALRERLARGEQSLVFVNRRGYSPVLFCRDCAWHSECPRCSANMVLHRGEGLLRCHHCGHRERVPVACPQCGNADLAPVGQGTQRIEDALREALPTARIARADRDSTAKKGAFREILDGLRAGTIDVVVGTQMLAKGHDYPNLTLVGIVDTDAALFSADFRAPERLFALLLQVAGRAGRGERPGEVVIQTDFPIHPLYAAVARHDFERFAAEALEERRMAGFPPFAHLALLRAESKRPGEAIAFTRAAASAARRWAKDVDVFDAVPASLERKAGFERAQLMVRSTSRGAMQRFLAAWRETLRRRDQHRVRWTLDVDPQEI